MAEKPNPFNPNGTIKEEWRRYMATSAGEDWTDEPLYNSRPDKCFEKPIKSSFYRGLANIVSAVICGCFQHRKEAERLKNFWGLDSLPDRKNADVWQMKQILKQKK
jgi:hypothetical protein